MQSPLNQPAQKMSIQIPAVCQPAVGIWLTPTGLQNAAFQKNCCKNNTPAIPLSNTRAQLYVLAKKNWAVVLHPALPSALHHFVSELLLLAFGIQHRGSCLGSALL